MNQIEMKKRQLEMGSYVLGLIVLLVLGNILEDNGIAYLGIAVEILLIFWTFTGSKLADTLGRILRGRSSKGQYKNATKMRRNALVLEGFLGIVGSVVMFSLAEPLGEGLFGASYSVAMIRIMAPIVFVRTMSSVLLGYFQGEGTELPTVISGFMRQICIFLLSLLLANLFKGYGSKVSDLLRQENFTAMYGGMGVAVAILVSEVLILIFLLLVYRGSRRREKRGNGEGMRTTDTFGGQVATLYGSLFPAMLNAFLTILPLWLGVIFFRKSVPDVGALNQYGLFYGKVIPLAGILILPGCMMLLECAHKTAACFRREEQRYARGHFQAGVHMSFVYGAFTAVFAAILAPHIVGVFCKSDVELTTQMFRLGAFFILIAIISFYLTEILNALGGKYYILGLLAVFNLLYAGSLVLFLNSGKAGIVSLLYAALVAGSVYMTGAAVLTFRQLRCGLDWLQGMAVPVGVSCIVGLLLLFLSKVMHPHLGDLITLIVTFVLGNMIYWIILMVMHNFREQELSYIPWGKLIRAMGQTLRVY